MAEETTKILDELSLDDLFKDAITIEEAEKILGNSVSELESKPDFVAGFLAGQVVNDIYRAIKNLGITQSELARRAGMSRQSLNRILREKENLTLETLSIISIAIGWKPLLHILPEDEWIEASSTVGRIQKSKLDAALLNPGLETQANLTSKVAKLNRHVRDTADSPFPKSPIAKTIIQDVAAPQMIAIQTVPRKVLKRKPAIHLTVHK